MSVLSTNSILVATCGAVLGCASAYVYGGTNQLVTVAGVVGTIALETIYTVQSTISRRRIESEMEFEAFSLDITPYKSLGNITTTDLMAHKAFGEGGICSYLRKMDLTEYEIIQTEHYVAKKAWDLSGPATTGGVISAISGVGVWFFAEVVAFVPTMLLSVGMGLFGGSAHAFCKIAPSTFEMDGDRAGRLAGKISDISARISKKESTGNHTREVAQLQIACDYFTRNLQAYEKSREISMTPTKSPERMREVITGYSRNGTAQYKWS